MALHVVVVLALRLLHLLYIWSHAPAHPGGILQMCGIHLAVCLRWQALSDQYWPVEAESRRREDHGSPGSSDPFSPLAYLAEAVAACDLRWRSGSTVRWRGTAVVTIE